MKEISPVNAADKEIYPKELALITACNESGQRMTVVLFDSFRGGMISIKKSSPLHAMVSKTGEYVISYPSGNMEQAVRACLADPEGHTGLETMPSKEVRPPLIKGCMGNYECKVKETIDAGDSTIFNGDQVVDHTSKEKSTRLYMVGRDAQGEPVFKGVEAFSRYPQRMALIVSQDARGKPNVMTIGWSMHPSLDPYMVAIWIGKKRYSHDLIKRGGDFVFTIPSEGMQREVSYCGTHSGRDTDKFTDLALATKPAKVVRPPLLTKCVANLECKIINEIDWKSHTVFIGKVVAAHVAEKKTPMLFYLGGAWEDLSSYGPLPE